MIKLCGKSMALPIRFIFQSISNDGAFPEDWKRSYIVPCYKKESKNLIQNYRPICPLQIFNKVFERLNHNPLYNYLMQNKLFTNCQFGFMPGDLCVSKYCQIPMTSAKALILIHLLM